MKKIYVLLFMSLVFCFNGKGQENYVEQLTDSLMYGGRIRVAAKNSTCLLVGTEGGIFKSTDNGQHWTNATKNFNLYSVNCNELVSVGDNFFAHCTSWAVSGLFKSSDNGENWTEIATLPNIWIQTLGKLGNMLYIVGGSMTGEGGKLYASTDGISWTPKATLWEGTWIGGNCELYSFSPDKLYLNFQDNLSYTTDGTTLIPISTNGLNITNFSDIDEIGGDAMGNLYCLNGDENAIFKYDFTTQTWTNISQGKIPEDCFILNLSVTDHAIFFNTLNQDFDMKLYKSVNEGGTFTQIEVNGSQIPLRENIVEIASNTFIGNGLIRDIDLSTDGGQTWTVINQFVATYAGNLVRSGNSLLYSREMAGIIASEDKGESWKTANLGIPSFGGAVYSVRELTEIHDTLFSLLQESPFSDKISLYRSTDHGSLWEPFPIPDVYSNGEDYYFAGQCDSILFIGYYDEATSKFPLLSLSLKDGSWIKRNDPNTPLFLNGSKEFLFAFSKNNEWDNFDNVYKANNFGESFTDISQSIINQENRIKKLFQNEDDDKGGAIMDTDNPNHKALFVVHNQMNGIDKIYKFDLVTPNWAEVKTNGLPENYVGNCLNYIGNNEWLLATNLGLYRSTDGGVNWSITHNNGYWQNGIIVNSIVKMNNK
ncbi:MAG TPA: hypothetical protein PLE52_07725, partial [Paludibacteraceae bacterium]|nr:hypothetical protein [Paludibacteraceae bacterium]